MVSAGEGLVPSLLILLEGSQLMTSYKRLLRRFSFRPSKSEPQSRVRDCL